MSPSNDRTAALIMMSSITPRHPCRGKINLDQAIDDWPWDTSDQAIFSSYNLLYWLQLYKFCLLSVIKWHFCMKNLFISKLNNWETYNNPYNNQLKRIASKLSEQK